MHVGCAFGTVYARLLFVLPSQTYIMEGFVTCWLGPL
jgi:hypothetical protein